MTLLEKFKLDHPNATMTNDGVPIMCPRYLGYVDEEECKYNDHGYYDCKTCWNREYKGGDTVEASKDIADKITDTFVKLHETFDHGVSIAIVYRLIDRGYFDK